MRRERQVPVLLLKEGDIFKEELLPGSRKYPYELKVTSLTPHTMYGVQTVTVRVEIQNFQEGRNPAHKIRRIPLPMDAVVTLLEELPNVEVRKARELRTSSTTQ